MNKNTVINYNKQQYETIEYLKFPINSKVLSTSSKYWVHS